ncbi:hypothetical protein GINT2_001411 [Glugoides intestinalis]
MIVISSFLLSGMILTIALLIKRRSPKQPESNNKELDKFYEMFEEPVGAQIKQLTLAAKTTLRNLSQLSKEKMVASRLFEERIVSDRFYNKFKSMEEELIVEKTLIENEADFLRAGAKESLFSEASKLANAELLGSKKQKIFDEALFLKKASNLSKDLHSRIVQ